MEKDNYRKNRTICKNCYNEKKRRNTLIQCQQAKDDNVNTHNNKWTRLVGLGFSGKAYLMLKILSKMPDRDLYIIIKTPLEQYFSSKSKIKKNGEEIRLLSEYENPIVFLMRNLSSSNRRDIDEFFIRGKFKNLDKYCLSQSCFDLSK